MNQKRRIIDALFILLFLVSCTAPTPTTIDPSQNAVAASTHLNPKQKYLNIHFTDVKVKKTNELDGKIEFRLLAIVSDGKNNTTGLNCPDGAPLQVNAGETINPCLAGFSLADNNLGENLYIMLSEVNENNWNPGGNFSYDAVLSGMSYVLGTIAITSIIPGGVALSPGVILLNTAVGTAFNQGGGIAKKYFEKATVLGNQTLMIERKNDWSSGRTIVIPGQDIELTMTIELSDSPENPPELQPVNQPVSNPTQTVKPAPTISKQPDPLPTHTSIVSKFPPVTGKMKILLTSDCDPRVDPDQCNLGNIGLLKKFHDLVLALDAELTYQIPHATSDLYQYDIVILDYCGQMAEWNPDELKSYIQSGGSVIIQADNFCSHNNQFTSQYATGLADNFGISFSKDDDDAYQQAFDITDHPINRGVNKIYSMRHAYLSVNSPAVTLAKINERPFVAIYEGKGTVVAIADGNFEWNYASDPALVDAQNADNFVFWKNMLVWMKDQSRAKRK